MKTSKAQIRASNKYNRDNTRAFCIRLNKNTDSEIITYLDQIENKTGYIKRLISEDMGYGSMKKGEK